MNGFMGALCIVCLVGLVMVGAFWLTDHYFPPYQPPPVPLYAIEANPVAIARLEYEAKIGKAYVNISIRPSLCVVRYSVDDLYVEREAPTCNDAAKLVLERLGPK